MGTSHTMRAEVTVLSDVLRRADAAGVSAHGGSVAPGVVVVAVGHLWAAGPLHAQLARGRRRRYVPAGDWCDQDTGEWVSDYRGPRGVRLSVRAPALRPFTGANTPAHRREQADSAG